jgi:hypothetical protein
MRKILSEDGRLLHQVVDCSLITTHESISDADEPLQVQVSLRKAGEKPDAHFHLSKKKNTSEKIQESWFVVSGRLLCHLFDERNELIESVVLMPGWLCVTYRGGHSFEVLEDAVLLEHKNGPYFGRSKDKVIFPHHLSE